jgi:hypothetical protein
VSKITELKTELKAQIDKIQSVVELEQITAFVFHDRMAQELKEILQAKDYSGNAIKVLVSDIIKMLLDSPTPFSEKTLFLKTIKDTGFLSESAFLGANSRKYFRDIFSVQNEVLNNIYLRLITYTPQIGSVNVGAGETFMILGLLKGSDPAVGDIAVNSRPFEVKSVSNKTGGNGARFISTKGDRADPPAVRLKFYSMITEYFRQFNPEFVEPNKNEYAFNMKGVENWNRACQALVSNSMAGERLREVRELIRKSIKLIYFTASDQDLSWINKVVDNRNQMPYINWDKFKIEFALFQWLYYKKSEEFVSMVFVNQVTGAFMLISTEAEMRRALESGVINITPAFDWTDKRKSTYSFGLRG